MEPLITFTSISDKLFDSTVPLIFDRENLAAIKAAQNCYDELLEVGRASGCFPYRIGVNTMSKLASLQTDSSEFHRRLRKDLDPHDIIAPGRYR